MDVKLIIAIVLAHYVGDWVFQVFFQKWMGKKNSSFRHLSIHVAALTVPLMLIDPVWGLLNGVAHGGVDAITSRMTHYFYNNGKHPMFWLTIGTDQTIHLVTLFGTGAWLI